METLLLIAYTLFVWILSSIAHEADLSRNFKKYGNAKAWFFEIKR